jgi:type 2A phosphatase activator TIP41
VPSIFKLKEAAFRKELAVMAQPAVEIVGHVLLPNNGGIDVGGWSVRAHRGAIASSSREDAIAAELGIQLPGMLFDSSSLKLTHLPSGMKLCFNTIDALRGVGPVDPAIRVKAAKVWDAREAPRDVKVGVLEGASDWTFATRYGGTVGLEGSAGGVAQFISSNPELIDYTLLRRMDIPILFFEDVILFEDELDDNGIASYRVRVRVMPGLLFVLARYFLRVDDVLVRVYDTRYYHKFCSNVLVRERSVREAPFETLKGSLPSEVMRNVDQLAAVVPLVSTVTDNLNLGTPLPAEAAS